MKKEFLLYIALFTMAICLFGLESNNNSSENNYHFKTFEISDIKELEVNLSANIYFISSENYELKMEGDRSLIEQIKVENTGKNISIGMKKTISPLKLLQLTYSSGQPLNIYISAPNAKGIHLNNRHNFNASNYYENGDVAMITLKSPKLFAGYQQQAECCDERKVSNS